MSLPPNLDGLIWLFVALVPLIILQRNLHRETQAVLLMITRRADIAVVMFSIVFFPGIVLHECSHFVMARLLGIRTGRISLMPHPLPDGRLQLGFVETAPADWLRDAMIGAAPLLTGGIFVAYAGLAHLGLASLWEGIISGGPEAFLDEVPVTVSQPDFWLWFYLTVVVSSTMLPSPSDRRAWLPLIVTAALLLGVALLAGAGPWLEQNLAPYLNRVLRSVAVAFGISLVVHLVLLPPIWGLRRLLGALTGVRVV